MRDVSFPLRDLHFPSGLRVIVEEDHRAPVVGVFSLVGAGSTSDPPGKEGLAHYVEHLAFRSRPDGKNSVWSLIERAGAGAWNASTSLDETLYWDVGPKEALPSLLLLEGVRLLAPVSNITPEVAGVERGKFGNHGAPAGTAIDNAPPPLPPPAPPPHKPPQPQ